MAKRRYTDEFLIMKLKEYAASIKKTPTHAEFEKDSSVPSAKSYTKRFGTWNNAIELAGLKSNAIRKFTKEEIIQDALDFYEKEKRSPHYNELRYSKDLIKKYWRGWAAFLLDIGLPPNLTYSKVTTKPELILFLQTLSKELGRIPNTTDVKDAGVGRHLFLQKFGSYKNALLESKIVTDEYFRTLEDRLPDSIKAIQSFYEKNNRPPRVAEYEYMSKKDNLVHRKGLEELKGKRFTEICMETIGVANQYKRSKGQLLSDLRLLKEQLGRTPLANELVLYGLAEKKQYYRTFKMTYMDLVESLGWELSVPRGNFRTEEQLLDDYQKLYDLLGRLPLYSDINQQDGMSSSNTYQKYFGDLPTIWNALNIEVDSHILSSNYGMGFPCIDKSGGICRSVPEMRVTNILIDAGLDYDKEILYRKFIPDLPNKYRADWVLKEKPIVIEYFGLFSEYSLKEDTIIGRYSQKVLEKIRLCEENKVNLIDLYSEDLDNLEEILFKRLHTVEVRLDMDE